MTLVTIYITNFNYGRFIKQAIESVLNQSYPSIEIIIIDDGSTDNSKEIIETYRNSDRFTIIYQQNKGLNISNNVAMRAANGKYLMRLDADDYLTPNAVEEMVMTLEADNELGLVFPDYYYVNEQGAQIGVEHRHNFNKEVSLYDQPAHGACTMVRLAFLKALGGYNESFDCQDGYDLWIKFVTHYKVSNVSKPLFYYRQHGKNLTTNEKRILDTRKKIKEVFVEQYLNTPRTLAVIPVRQGLIAGEFWPMYSFLGEPIVVRKIKAALRAKRIEHVAVCSSDENFLATLEQYFEHEPAVSILFRPKALEQPNVTLAETILLALNQVEKDTKQKFEAVMSISLEYPFVEEDVFDDAVNTMALFKSDSLISVKPDNNMYFKHSGHSLVPILEQDKFTKLEREAIYQGVGGIVLATTQSFREKGTMLGKKVSHIVLDTEKAFFVNSAFALKVMNALNKHA